MNVSSRMICAMAIVLIVSFMVSGCEQNPEKVILNTGETSITWLEYDGTGNADRAVYLVNRRVVGTGKSGFLAVIDLVGKLPTQSTILVYPKYQLGMKTYVFEDGSTYMEMDSGSRNAFQWVPFLSYPNEYKKILQIISEKEINAFISIDEKGTDKQPLSTCDVVSNKEAMDFLQRLGK